MAAGGILRRIGIALGVEVDEKKAEAGVDKIKSYAKKALGAIAIGVSFAKINALAGEFGAVNKVIKDATSGMEDQTEVQNKIMQAANATKSAYADTAKVVSSLVRENKELFGNVDEAVKFNNAATMLFKNAGKTDDQIAGLMESINKSFAKGAVDSETFNQLMEQSPEAVELLEKKLGVTKEKFNQLVSDGKVGLKDLKEAFTDSSDEIEKKFLESGVSIGDATKNMRNQWGLYVAQVWNGAGVSQHVGKLMMRAFNEFMAVLKKAQPTITGLLTSAMNWLDKISDGITRLGSFLGRLTAHIGGVENAVKLLLIVAAALWIAFNFSKIVSGFAGVAKAIKGLFSPKNFKTAAIVAAIVLIALAVEDFINFMQGNESVIGLIFEQNGISAEKARETIIGCFNKIKSTVGNVLSVIGGFISDHKATLLSLGSAVLKFVVIVGACIAVAQTVMTVASAVGAAIAFLTSPIGMVVAAIVALIAIGVLLYQNWNTIVEYAMNLKESVVAAFENVKAGVESKVEGIKTSIVNGFNAAIAWIKSLPSQAVSWGQDFVDGLVSGITGRIGKVTDAVKGLADKVKSYLHFSRPDEGPLREYEEWMPDFVDGLAKTLKSSRPQLVAAVRGISSALDIKPTVNTTNTLIGTNKAGNMVHQQIEIHNTVKTSDANAGRTASKQMEKSGQDITKEIAKGLAFGR